MDDGRQVMAKAHFAFGKGKRITTEIYNLVQQSKKHYTQN